MPNHVTHKMQFLNEAARSLAMEIKLRPRKEDAELLDFNMFIPEPEYVGKEDWYGWRIAHWGTKWGAYSCTDFYEEDGYPTIKFDTAWSTAVPVWEKLAEMYPDATIVIYYADEDTGHNLGVIEINQGGVVVDERSNDSLEEKLNILNEIHGQDTYIICGKGEKDYLCGYHDDGECKECLEGQ